MKAQLLGFYWEFLDGYAKNLSLDDLLKHLKKQRNTEFEYGGYERLIYANSYDGYVTGLLLTAKNQKRFCELHRAGKSLKINVREVEQGASLIDFNFFLIDKTTSRGFYQYYHNSCNVRVFTRLCSHQLGKVADDRIAAEINAKGGLKNCPDDEQDKIRDKYSGDLACALHVRKEKFAQIVKHMKSISNFDFELATIEPEKEKWFKILKGVANIVRHRVSFTRKASVAERAAAVIDLVESGEVDTATVKGVDEDDLEKVISLANNPDSFGSWEFDTLAAEMTFEPEHYEKSKIMKTLVALADKQDAFLRKKAK